MNRTVLIAVLVVAMLFGVIAYANAAGNSVTVSASVPAVVQLTIVDGDETATLAGTPGGGIVTDTASMKVRSNVAYNVSRAVSPDNLTTAFGANYSVSGATGSNFPAAPSAAGATHTDTFSLDYGDGTNDWPAYNAGVSNVYTYSVVQY